MKGARPRVELIVLGLIALAALALRMYYVRTTYVPFPIRGDALQYRAYAWNLIHHHVFSGMLPYAPYVVPDSFRDPGYPAFLALMAGYGDMNGEYLLRVLDAQCLLSALTGWLFSLLARRWMGFGAALATGIIIALWPHTITMAGYQLSETLLGFLVALSLFFLDESARKHGNWRPLLAGLSLSLAGLTNAVMAPFGIILAAIMAWKAPSDRKSWMLIVAATLIPLAAWSMRTAFTPAADASSGSRAMMNFVQGAWPEYHPASRDEFQGKGMRVDVMAAIDSEYQALRTDTPRGLEIIGRRMASAPGRYVSWYLSKPVELWGWDIGVGVGDIYLYPTLGSPLSTQSMLSAVVGGYFLCWPVILLLAAVGGLLTLLPANQAPVALTAALAMACWITMVYWILQSDARYSTPFRGIEVVLAAYTIHQARIVLAKRRRAAR